MSNSEVRLDRLATLYFCRPISRLFAGQRKAGIPILMYHAVQESSSCRRAYYDINVSRQVFAAQIRQLRDQGFRAVSLEEAVLALGREDSRKLVVITFDDGYGDFYEDAFPILREYQYTATVFLMSGFVADQAVRFKGKQCLTWQQVRELYGQGIRFGSHTVTHPQLRTLSRQDVEAELADSKHMIEDRIGAAVRSFSYPYAFPEADQRFRSYLRDVLLKHGYENGVTTILGTANSCSDRQFLPRLPINQWDDPLFFQAKLEGCYDWLHVPQRFYKRMKTFVKDGRDKDGRGHAEPTYN